MRGESLTLAEARAFQELKQSSQKRNLSRQDDKTDPHAPQRNFGQRLSFLVSGTLHGSSAHGGTNVDGPSHFEDRAVSMAHCAPLKSDKPSTTTSTLIKVVDGVEISDRGRFVRTQPPASRQIHAAAFFERNPLSPSPPLITCRSAAEHMRKVNQIKKKVHT